MRVVIGEDEALLRGGLQALLSGAGMDVEAAVGNADELLEVCRRVRPDVVVTDIRMPPGDADDGLRAALTIRATMPGVGVMVLSKFVQRRYAVELIGTEPAGVGYLLKQRIGDVEQFCEAVARVAEGGTAMDPEVVQIMLARVTREAGTLNSLTVRQTQVLAMIAEGRSNAAIAAELGISEKGVVQHTSRIYHELELPTDGDDHRRVLAVIRYLSR